MAAMSTIKQNFRSPPGPLKDQGFGLTETLVAVVAGALLITATAIGVRTISTAIHRN
jgi:prepilin-type N-terminal cleavage/methylation domain-containing protein